MRSGLIGSIMNLLNQNIYLSHKKAIRNIFLLTKIGIELSTGDLMAQDEFEIRYPRKGDQLVEEGGDVRTLFGDWIKGKWFSYADGYKTAADLLVEKIEGHAPEDILVLPIVFMYRHHVELKLKYIITALDILSQTQIPNLITHNLISLWNYIKDHLGCIRGGPFDTEMMSSLDRLIAELSNLDPDSYRFRYSHDTKFNENDIPRSINLSHFKATMQILSNGLSLIESGIDYERDCRALDADIEAQMAPFTDF